MITNVIIEDNGSGCKNPLLRFEVKLKDRVEQLRKHIFDLVFDIVIKDENVQQLEFKGQKLIIELFQVLKEDPKGFYQNLPRKFGWMLNLKTSLQKSLSQYS